MGRRKCGHMVADGRRWWSCRSCCCMCRMFFCVGRRIEILCVGLSGTPSTNRIASTQTRIESSGRVDSIRLQMPGSDVDVLCVVMRCAVLSPAPRGKEYPSTNPAARQGPLCRQSPAQRGPSQPPAHLIDSPATRIATRHRDRFFLGCVIHAGSRGWYLTS